MLNNSTLKSFFWRALYTVCRQGVPLFIFALVLFYFPKEQVGIYSYIFSIALGISLLSDFGLGTAVSRFTAEATTQDVNVELSKVWSSGLVMLLGAGLFVSFGTIIFVSTIESIISEYFIYIIAIAILSPALSLYDGLYRGLKKFEKQSKLIFVASFFSTLASFLLIQNYGIEGALLSHIIFLFFSTLLLVIFFKPLNFSFDLKSVKKVSAYAITFGTASLGYWLFSRSDIVILGNFGYYEFIASYELATRFFVLALAPFFILGQVIAPDFSASSAKREYKKIYEATINYSIKSFFAAVLIGLAGYVALLLSLNTILTEYNTPGMPVILILATSIFILNASAATVDAGLLVSTGNADLMMWFYLVLGIVNIGGSRIAINIYSNPIVVLYVTLVSTLIMVVGLRIVFLRRLIRLNGLPIS